MQLCSACYQGVQVSSQQQSIGIQCNIDLDASYTASPIATQTTSYHPANPIATDTTPALDASFEEHSFGEEESEYVPSSTAESDSGDDIKERQVFSTEG